MDKAMRVTRLISQQLFTHNAPFKRAFTSQVVRWRLGETLPKRPPVFQLNEKPLALFTPVRVFADSCCAGESNKGPEGVFRFQESSTSFEASNEQYEKLCMLAENIEKMTKIKRRQLITLGDSSGFGPLSKIPESYNTTELPSSIKNLSSCLASRELDMAQVAVNNLINNQATYPKDFTCAIQLLLYWAQDYYNQEDIYYVDDALRCTVLAQQLCAHQLFQRNVAVSGADFECMLRSIIIDENNWAELGRFSEREISFKVNTLYKHKMPALAEALSDKNWDAAKALVRGGFDDSYLEQDEEKFFEDLLMTSLAYAQYYRNEKDLVSAKKCLGITNKIFYQLWLVGLHFHRLLDPVMSSDLEPRKLQEKGGIEATLERFKAELEIQVVAQA
tara:strand:- start:1018 stop:2187 length:1170 start_codon:yes stop_codon:yes gene_type:complete